MLRARTSAFPALFSLLFSARPALSWEANVSSYRSPLHIVLTKDERRAYVVNHTAGSVSVLDAVRRKVTAEIRVGSAPVCAVLSPDEKTLYVSDRYRDAVDAVDLASLRVARSYPVGMEPYGLALSADGRVLYVAESQADTVSALDTESGETLWTLPSGREPRYLALSPGDKLLAASNSLSRSATLFDPRLKRVVETREFARASILRGLDFTPDGRRLLVAHILSHDEVSTLQMERGWIHSNGFSIADLDSPGRFRTLLLDKLLDGAANPWEMIAAPDGKRLYVVLSGVHEVAFIDAEKAFALSEAAPDSQAERLSQNVEALDSLAIARRVPAGGRGPRAAALAFKRKELLVANYFSDVVAVLDSETGDILARVPLGASPPQESLWRKGEGLFNDAGISFQRWFSCASCHQEDATVDGLNWDLPNDGLTNFKNAKSLHDAYDTPPAMWTGVRADMEAAVRAGQRFGGFLPVEENHRALMAFLGDPPRAPNPHRRLGNPEAAARGAQLFIAGACQICHPAPKYTDGRAYDVGIAAPTDQHREFDTPSLRECYRTAPYFHDGRAQTLREVISMHNPYGVYGLPKNMSTEQVSDLAAFLKTL